ncbi:hypothetical protein JOB18_041986 [Solea senegalensis]|uniref:Secreted protein n=1 Tax=Solea senegalensis TaxID=28829 RepID=A0AAV6RUE3_SOLSE|nr:hypothetical protein JOB18_041986 [Solea senegalensis]
MWTWHSVAVVPLCLSAPDTEKGLVKNTPGRIRLQSLSATGSRSLARTEDNLCYLQHFGDLGMN